MMMMMLRRDTSIHMNGSCHGDHSYANNSVLQRTTISKVKPKLEQTIRTMKLNKVFHEKHFVMADLGCASGPNTLLSISLVIEAILGICQSPPELQVFLNDLPENDFNSLFLLLPAFYERLQSKKSGGLASCYISGTPGSFHGRLFPASSLHFAHSFYSLQWLSQAPQGIVNNKGNIYLTKSSPRNVVKAYLEQFQRDFSNCLSNRAKELKPGGVMIFAFIGRGTADPASKGCCTLMELVSKSLLDMVSEGLIQESKLDSFNLPNYYASKEEVKEIVEREGSFSINNLDTFECNWDGNDNEENESYVFDKQRTGQSVANCIRAVLESILASHFGNEVIDDLFGRFATYVGEHLSVEKTKFDNIVISMTKK